MRLSGPLRSAAPPGLKRQPPRSRIILVERRRLNVVLSGRGLAYAATALVAAAPLPMPFSPGTPPQPTARSAQSQRLAITAHLHYVNARGSYLIEEGRASGPLAGVVKAQIRVTATISGSFMFYPHGGSISGSGSGKLHESGIYASFGGSVTVVGGTGRYAHAHGGGELYGVYNRKTLGVTISTTGSLSY
jgi:hypothetical protein